MSNTQNIIITKNNWLKKIVGLLLLYLLFITNACTTSSGAHTKNAISIDSIQHAIQNGDLILRNGTDEVSAAARSFGRKEKIFSHCGIIQIENDTAWVYHALGGKYNPSNQLKKEALSSFCNAKENDKIAIYRYSLSKNEKQNLTSIVNNYYIQKLPFDLFFNFNTDDAMYCAEFVFKSYNQAMHQKLNPTLTKDAEGRIYVTVDDLYLNQFCKPILKGNL